MEGCRFTAPPPPHGGKALHAFQPVREGPARRRRPRSRTPPRPLGRAGPTEEHGLDTRGLTTRPRVGPGRWRHGLSGSRGCAAGAAARRPDVASPTPAPACRTSSARPSARPAHAASPPSMRRQPVEQVGAVDQPAADQVRDRHLGALGLPLDPPLGDQQPRADQRRAVALAHVGVDDEVGGAELVLHGDEHHALGGARAAGASAPGRAAGPTTRAAPRDKRRVSCRPSPCERGPQQRQRVLAAASGRSPCSPPPPPRRRAAAAGPRPVPAAAGRRRPRRRRPRRRTAAGRRCARRRPPPTAPTRRGAAIPAKASAAASASSAGRPIPARRAASSTEAKGAPLPARLAFTRARPSASAQTGGQPQARAAAPARPRSPGRAPACSPTRSRSTSTGRDRDPVLDARP